MDKIRISHLLFGYDNDPILDQEFLEIPKGSFTGIIGPNGGGKTTFLKLLMGFLKPQRGNIDIFGLKPNKARTKIGYVPQAHKCDREFPITVRELILLGGYPQKLTAQADSLMKELGLFSHAKKMFGSLSGGLAQRALLGRALLSNPEILLLDEPTANVDPESTQAIIDKLSSFRGKKTILIVTHDFKTIKEEVDQVLCFQGKITPFKPEEICEHFSFGIFPRKEEYVPSPV